MQQKMQDKLTRFTYEPHKQNDPEVLESKSESAGKQGFVNYFVSYSLVFFSKKPKSLNVCIKIDQLI